MATATEQFNVQIRDCRDGDDVQKICFVCTGNTCRSPMAAAVANAQAHKSKIALKAFSAGLYASEGAPISPNAISALENAGVEPIEGADYHAHVAHTITEDEIRRCDLLVPMTRTHAMELILRYPNAAKKILCMPQQISDPYGGDLGVYEKCLAEITDGVRALLKAEV